MSVIEVGAEVQDAQQRDRRGVVLEMAERLASRDMVKVRWADGRVQTIPLGRLEIYTPRRDVRTLLREHSFGTITDFVRNYTHRKLLNPVDDTLYTLHASRTRLLPHQFKPLIKFLDSIHRRFLIADEVGLGKTIEAGIILSELRARGRLRSVLIFCPNHLRTKWSAEMANRFDERFHIIASRADWEREMARASEEGMGDRRLIVGHKTLSARAILEQTEDGAPGFDLVIVDEAHHFKSPETLGRRLLGELADSAGQLILLTATPVQTHADNLLSLLRLLDHPAFTSRELFEQRLSVNARLVRAEKALRVAEHTPEAIRAALHAAAAHVLSVAAVARQRFGVDASGLAQRLTEMAADPAGPGVDTLVEAATAVRDVNLLSPYITRTRKVEVQQTCRRQVESVRPDALTAAERAFYDGAVAWFRAEVARRHGDRSVLFLSRTFERRLASSLHGFARFLLRGGHRRDGALLGDPPPDVLRAAHSLGSEDSKLARLVELLDAVRADHPGEKVIVFASYRGTLDYLSRRLAGHGWEHEVIHGGVPMVTDDERRDERGRRVRRFLEDPECRLLLSSNVGGEGLDLQRASIVVNYDLPWNPATLEQRIGRVDRYGQEAAVIRVLNLVLPDTVEDVVFSRIVDRLDLFETAIGEFAEILGGYLRRLSERFLRAELSLEELEEQARAAALRVEQNRKNLDAVLDRERELVAFDEDFADQISAMEGRAQTVKPADLQRLVDGILTERFTRSWLRPSATAEGTKHEGRVFEFYVDPELKRRLQELMPGNRDGGVIFRFIRAVNEREVVRVTFDGDVAESDDQLILLTSRHPVLQMLVRHESDPASFHPVSSVRVARTHAEQDAREGLLVLADARFSLGSQQRRYLLPVWVSPAIEADVQHARAVLRGVLDDGESARPARDLDGELLCALVDRAEDAAQEELLRTLRRIVAQEETRIRPRVAEAEDRYTRRLERAATRLQELVMEDDGSERAAKRLKNAREYRRRLEREMREKLEELNRLPEPEWEVGIVGATWVEFA